MPPRTLFAWLLVALAIIAGGFFTYHIASVATSNNDGNDPLPLQGIQPINSVFENPVHAKGASYDDVHFQHAEPLDAPQQQPLPMPAVAGQTEEDLRETRQVIESPPTVEYPPPEAMDPLEGPVNSESEFGDNLRHPEQVIEMAPPMGTVRIANSGLGSDELPSLGGHQSVQYSPEMAQNGGEFMSGIYAYDVSDMGVGYTMI